MRTLTVLISLLCLSPLARAGASGAEHHLLYVAEPGIRNETNHGGRGVLVFDIDDAHRFVRRISVPALCEPKTPEAVRGICASAVTGRLYVSTTKRLTCLDLSTDKMIWEKSYDSGCDRMSMTPDGKVMFEPTMEGKYWHVLDAADGHELAKIETSSGAHNTVMGRDGRTVFLAGLHSPVLTAADTASFKAVSTVGPFAGDIRPFTVNGSSTICYVCVNGLLGFEMGDIRTGKKLCRVEVSGFSPGPVSRHGCPSHGIGLTPDEKQVWVADAHNRRLHVFDNTAMPPRQVASVALRAEPGWVTFGIGGKYAYASTGDVIDVASQKVVAGLKDDTGQDVQSEKLLEVDFAGDKPLRAGDQFGVGQLPSGESPGQ